RQRADEPNPLVAVQQDVGDPAEPEFLTFAFDEPTHHGIAVEETHEFALNLVEDPDLLQHILDIGPARCRIVHDRFGIESAFFSACVLAMSGAGAPSRTTTPTPTLPSGTWPSGSTFAVLVNSAMTTGDDTMISATSPPATRLPRTVAGS